MTGAGLVLALVALPLLAGAVVLTLLGVRPRDDRVGYWGWAWLAGSLAVSLVLFLALLPGLEYLPAVAAACAALAVVVLVRRWRRQPRLAERQAGDDRKLHPLERALFAAVLGAALLVAGDQAFRADSRAVVGRDEAHIWAAKAKTLYAAGGFNGTFQDLLSGDSIVYHQDYPLLNPLLQLGSFALAGRILHAENRVPIQALFLALILAAAAALRRATRPALAAGLLALLTTAPVVPQLTSHAHADHLVALGLLVTLDAWGRYQESGSRRWWRLMAVALTFTAWSKNEGLMLAVLASACAAAALGLGARQGGRTRWRLPPAAELRWLLLPLGVAAAQLLVNAFFGLRNDMADGLAPRLLAQLGDHAPVVAGHFAGMLLLDPPATQLLFALFALLVALFPRRLARGEPGLVAAVLASALAVHFLVYVSTYHDLEWHLRTSSDRVLFQLMPAAALGIAAAAARVLPGTQPGRAEEERRWKRPPVQDR